ncbi:MAG: NAD-dependent epimerase/dehydratase family protein [Nanoarchaeota archaeon]|nr:NAD-dependent epimerase/dehydratase family protein [Nanoarchaeota archaeon]MBU1103118.1 NAD-dependent epimerase/dehydratase family protein [Nanoarchaeota archaeon]
MNLKNKKIIVTGGAGFLGRHIIQQLIEKEKVLEENISVPRSKTYDLRKLKSVEKLFRDFNADIVIHLATTAAGIGHNKEHPAELYLDTLLMGTYMMEQARLNNVKKFVAVGSAIAYPASAPIPLEEKDFWDGLPEKTLAPFGLATRILAVQAQAYRQQYGFNAIYIIPANIYGPGDSLDPEKSHVIPSAIMRIDTAIRNGMDRIEAWGSGNASREFLYIKDAARGIIAALKTYNGSEPVNLSSGMEITMKDLYNKISRLMDYRGIIIWNVAKPEGQLRRCMNGSKAREEFDFQAKTGFDEGLKSTVEWYLRNIGK